MNPNFSKELVAPVGNQLVTTSLTIAEKFGKKHKNVLRDIQNFDCSDEFSRLNFEPSEYKNERGKVYKTYNITKDGFLFLAMGFKGREAAVWKERFIAAFNHLFHLVESIRTNELKRLETMQTALFERNSKWRGILEAKAEGKTHQQTCELVDLKSTDTIRRNLRRMEAFGLTPLILSQQAQTQGLTLEEAIYLIAHDD